jgi:membrane protease YdiL (CAAX protease family)
MNTNINRNLFSIENKKLLRTLELFLIVLIAFAPEIFSSISIFLTGYEQQQILDARSALVFWGSQIITDIAAIAAVIYVLFRQGRSLFHIGFYFSKKDFFTSLLLASIAYGVYELTWIFICYGYYFTTGNTLSEPTTKNIEFIKSGITACSLLAMFINPFYEEIIVRAYTMSEIKFLTRSNYLAIFLSVAIQTSYHLYQGVFSALLLAPMFVVYSMYYLQTKRIMPVILAHMYFDLIALIGYSS